MFSIFSNYLALLGAKITAEMKISDIYNEMRIIQSRRKVLSECPRVFLSGNEEEDFDAIYAICTIPDLRDLLKWVNQNIILLIGIIDYRTIDVRIRIFTGMLNKINMDKNIALQIHQNVTSNVRQERSDLDTEDLPF